MKSATVLGIAFLLFLAFAAIPMASAQAPEEILEPGADSERRGPPTGLGFALSGGALHQFDTGMARNGSFDVTRTVIQGSVRYAFERDTFVGLSLSYGWDGYGFSPDVSIGGQSPWSQIQTLRVSFPMFYGVTEKLRLLAIPIVRLTAESTSDWGEGLTGGGIVGFSYQFGDRFRIGPGIGVFSEIDGDPSVFPVIVIDWKVTDRLRLETGRSLGATQGPGVRATYAFRPWLKASLGFRYEKLRFRLESNSSAQGGIGQDRGFPLLAGVTIGYPFAQLSVFGGARFAGELRIDDVDGRTLEKRSYDPSPFLGMSFRLLF